jgi:predicted component of type VI protein secretion system
MAVVCPFCQFQNEDGALFCEQCKSDLSAAPMEAAPVEAAVAEAPPMDAGGAAPAAAPEPAAAAPAAAPAAGEAAPLPEGSQPKLVVLRGLKINVEYPIYEGHNFVGRADEKPVDIDLDDQEPPDRVWSSRQHCLITFEGGALNLEDLNSANGTFVNRVRVYPGQKRPLAVGDVVQVGTVQLKVKV